MKKTLLATMMLLSMAISAHAMPVYEGLLATPTGVTATGIWSLDFNIFWRVELQNDAWWYQYTLTHINGTPLEPGAVSHLVIEVSPGVTSNDFWGFNGGPTELGSFSGITNGMKLDYGAGGQTQWSFFSRRNPTWGDFYAKDGRAGGMGLNTARNAGFANADPLDAPDNHSMGYKILRPDTQAVVPEPTTLGLLGAGLIGIAVRMRRKISK